MPKLKRGRSLEKLVAHLEKALTGRPGVTIAAPKKVKDTRTGRWREHDVWLDVAEAHHRLSVALECRDRSRSVGVPEIEAFHSKCHDTGVDQGVVVSASGFAASAIEKAGQYGIRCLDLEQAASLDWMVAPGLSLRRRRPFSVVCIFDVNGLDLATTTEHVIRDSSGAAVDPQALMDLAIAEFRGRPWDPSASGKRAAEFAIESPPLTVTTAEGFTAVVDRVRCTIEYDVTEVLVPLQLVKYSNAQSGDLITEAALADLAKAGLTGRLVIVYHPEKGGGVFYIRSP